MKKEKIYYGWYMVLLGFLIMAIVYASLASCQGIFVKPVTATLKIDRAAFSGVVTIMALGMIIGSGFMGKLIAKRGLKKVMSLCCTIVSVCLLCFSFSTNIWQFYIMSAFMGIAFAGIGVIPVSVLLNNWFGVKKKGIAVSIAFAGSGIGGMILTVVLNTVIQKFGWRIAYRVDAALIFFIIMPLLFLILIDTPEKKGLTRIGNDESILNSNQTGLTAAEAKKTMVFWIIFLSFLLMSTLHAGLLNHQIPYLSDIGFSTSSSARIGAIAVGSLCIGKILLGIICDKLGLKLGSFIGNFMCFLAMLCLFFTKDFSFLAYIYILMYCIAGSVATICPPLFVAQVFGEKDYGSLVGILNIAAGLGAAAGSLLCGKLYDMTGNYNIAWILFIIASIAIILLQCFSLNKKVTCTTHNS